MYCMRNRKKPVEAEASAFEKYITIGSKKEKAQ